MSTSDYNAIVPIKKRRFPLIQSSPPKEISSLPSLNDNVLKVVEPCVSDGPTVSNSSTITTSEFSEKRKISISEDGKWKSDLCDVSMVQNNIEPEPSEFQENDTGRVESKETRMVNENHALSLHEKPELKLRPSDLNSNPRLRAEKKSDEIDRKELDRCNTSTSVVKKEVESSVGLKEHLVPNSVLEGNNLEPGLLNLSLSKQGSRTHCLTGNFGSDYDGSLQQSNRENWDLNTSMEFWEGCASDDPLLHVPVVQTNTVVTTHRCSTEMVKTDNLSGKLTPLDHSDHLHLSLCSSDHRNVMNQEQSSFAKLDFRKSSPSLSSPEISKGFDDLNGALKEVVKPEPLVEGSKLESKSDKVNVLGLSNSAVVNREFLQLLNATDINRSMNIVKAKSVKCESIYHSKQEALKTLDGRLDLVGKQVLPEVDNCWPVPMPFVAEMSEAAGNPSCSTNLITDEDMSDNSELQTSTKKHLSTMVHQGVYGCGGELVKSEMTDISEDPGSKDSGNPIIEPIAIPVVAETLEAAKNPCTSDLIIDRDVPNRSELQTPTILGPLDGKVHPGGYGCGGELVKSEMTDMSEDSGSKHSSTFIKPIAMPFVAEMLEAAERPYTNDLIIDRDLSNHSELQTPTIIEPLNRKVRQGENGCDGELVKSEMTDMSEYSGSQDSSIFIKPKAILVGAEMLEAVKKPCTNDLTIDRDVSNHSELQTPPIIGPSNRKVHQGGAYGCDGGLVNSEMMDLSKDTCSKDSNSSLIKPFIVEDQNENNPQRRPLEHMIEQCSSLHGGEECSTSDEEKISISADLLEEDPYSSEYESDGKQDVNEAMDAVDHVIEEDYEDGEVREPILMTQVESSLCETKEVKKFDHSNNNEHPGSDCSSLVTVKQEDKSEILDVKQEDILHSVTSNQSSEQENLKELLVEGNATKVCLKKPNKAIKATGPMLLFHCEKMSPLEDRNISTGKGTTGIEELIATVSPSDAENVKSVTFEQNNDLTFPDVEEPLNNDDVTDDVTDDMTDDATGGNPHSQIVDPCEASTSFPIKTRPSLVKSVLTQTDRELIHDMAHEGEKLRPQRRDDSYRDVFPKFYVNRHQNLSSRTNFTHRRGRFTIRINSVQGEWDFNPTSPGVYNDQIPPYDARRRKYMPPVSDDGIDQNHYKMKSGGPFRSAAHRGRQILDDEGPLFCHMPSRRKSPCRRDGPPVRGVKMVHRIHRNISPNRCIHEPESELVGLRHGEKFMKNLEDETMDPMYVHPQPPFEVDRPHFIQDRRNFPIQRKSFPRVDSKSPGRSRGRSPGQWFPSKRKSERFFGHPEMGRRSPPGYRMRSPDHPPPIHGDMPIRRHGFPFPALPPNDLRDMGSARDHNHMRSGIRSRNRTDRISFRNRRFEDMNPPDRIESNEYFDGPVHPGQLDELVGDGNDDDRRRFPDRHEHLHAFRSQCNDSDGENYHNSADERPRAFRYCAEDEAEFHERGKMREREFGRRLKNQQGNLGRRSGRVIEEHEVEEYGHGRQLWNEHHHHGFEDISRMKRKRF